MAYFKGKQLLLVGLRGAPGETPYVGENGNWWVGENDTGVSSVGKADPRIDELEKKVADLLYDEISITKFSVSSYTNDKGETISGSTVELGSVVTAVKLSWAFNKTPKTLTLNGEEQSITSTGATVPDLNIAPAKQGSVQVGSLSATDEREKTSSKTASVSFVNGVYYGVAEKPATIDRDFILSLTRELRGSKLKSFSVYVPDDKYLWYCLPVSYGDCIFYLSEQPGVVGSPGGVGLVDTISFKNNSGYEESYNVYRSDYTGLENKAVTVV